METLERGMLCRVAGMFHNTGALVTVLGLSGKHSVRYADGDRRHNMPADWDGIIPIAALEPERCRGCDAVGAPICARCLADGEREATEPYWRP